MKKYYKWMITISLLLLLLCLIKMNNTIRVDWTNYKTLDFYGFNGYGSYYLKQMNYEDLDEMSPDVKKAALAYYKELRELQILCNYYYDNLEALPTEAFVYDWRLFVDLEFPVGDDVLHCNADKVIAKNQFDKLLKRIESFFAYETTNLFQCEVEFENGAVDGELSNGDRLLYACESTEFSKEVLNIEGSSHKKVTVAGLPEPVTLVVNDLVDIEYEIVRDYMYPEVITSAHLNESKLPKSVHASDITMEYTSVFDNYSLTLQSNRPGLTFIDETKNDAPSDTVKIEKKHPNGTYYLFDSFNIAVDEVDDYDTVAAVVYAQVEPLLEQINYTVTDSQGHKYIIDSIELTDYFYYDWGRSAGFKVQMSDGSSYHLLVNGTIANLLGKFEFILDPNFCLRGIIDSAGGIR